MLFIVSLVLALFTALFLDRQLKSKPAVFYISAAVLTAASIIVSQSSITVSSPFIRDYVIGMFSRGALGAAFWAIVMWTGALPAGSAPIKKLMPIRGELSITAAVLTLAHIVTFGMRYITSIINGRTGTGSAFRDFVITCILSVSMTLIMLPLTVMSFKKIRKKMNAKTWKKIQRLAYLFYAMIYIHIMVLFVPKAQKGREGYFLSILVYSAVFIGYAVLRLRKAYLSKNKEASRLIPNAVCAFAFIIPLCLNGIVSRSVKTEQKPVSTTLEPTFESPEDVQTTAETTSSTATATGKATTSVKTTTTAVTTSGSTGKTTESAIEETTQPITEEENVSDQQESNEPEETPQQSYRFRNGTFEGTGEGYEGKVHVTLTIEDDVITSINASSDDDPEYFDDAMDKVLPQIKSSMSADGVDACSGATYSSNGIIEAARKALEQAAN